MNTESIVRRRAPATLLATALAATALAGCGGQPADMHAALAGPVAETVNGEAVSEKLVQALAARRNLDLSKPELRERVLKQLTDMTLLAQEARKAGYAKDPDFQANAELGRLQGLAVAAMKAMADDNKVDDAAVRAEYERQFPGGNIRMYDFDQLSFESEDDAKRALTEIATGKTFDQVMEEHRKEARVSRNFPKMRAEQMPPPLLAAVSALKQGETTATPVELPQGWSLVRLDAAGTTPAPAFDKVEANLRRSLLRHAGEDRIAKLRADAKITVNEAVAGAEGAKSAAPAPAKPQ